LPAKSKAAKPVKVSSPAVKTPAATSSAAASLAGTDAATTSAVPKLTVSGLAIKTVLVNLSSILGNIILVSMPPVPLPSNILGTLVGPNGSPGGQLQIEVLPPTSAQPTKTVSSVFGAASAGSTVLAAGLTDANGNFNIPLPSGVVLPSGQSLSLRVRGASPTTTVPLTVPPNLLGPLGYIGTNTLNEPLTSIPPAIFNQLQTELSTGSAPSASVSPPSLRKLTFGDDGDCIKVLENQYSFEQYPYGIFFQLIAPTLYHETETINANAREVYQSYVRTDKAIDRIQVTQPISVDAFREGLLTGPSIVGSLGLGYVLRCSQNWTFQGLALGDLVYSLPLAPGEQQQVVVEEQSTTLDVQETEAVYGAQQSSASAVTDDSTQAMFNSAFNQAAQGGSSYNTSSSTSSGSGGGGLLGDLFGGGLLGILGGPSGSMSSTSSSGSASNWMDGLQDFAAQSAQGVQTYAAQQSASQRSAKRVAMRMATSSETTSVSTKTITNHNKLHALTMQYFEVVRQFSVGTSYDGVSLVCLVPLDIVWFLPPGQPEHLDDVITDSDLSNAIAYSSQLIGLAISATAELLQIQVFSTIPLLGSSFMQSTLLNVNAQLVNAGDTATSLSGILSGLGTDYATQVSEANQLKSEIAQAKTSVGKYQSTKSATDLANAQTVLNSAANTATALNQQLSSPTVSGTMTRQQVLDRYAGLLAHSDVLKVWIPSQYASGLTRLEKFAADPRASVAIDSLAQDIIQFTANASVLPFDHVYVSVVTRWGRRIGPVELIANPPVSIPGQYDASGAFKTSSDLLQYLKGQRVPGRSSAPTLQAAISLPLTLSPSDVVGFEITHTLDDLVYQLQIPIQTFVQLFGPDPTKWPPGVFAQGVNASGGFGGFYGLLGDSTGTQTVTYSANQLASEVGAPDLWNFQATLAASVAGSQDTYVAPISDPIELPPGILPIAAQTVSPILKYDDLILIENALQHVLRNMVRYSKAVWTWLTPEERVMLLQPYNLSFPGLTGGSVALLDCVGNEVLGYYGNCMMMPFSIPQALGQEQGWPMTTGQLEDSLLRFHRQSAPQQVDQIILRTDGVLGEAMLGHCASGEKIDLTRFWNWQDSPADTAPAIAPVTVPQSQVPTLAAAQAPDQLGGMLGRLVNNVNAPTVIPSDALAAALAARGPNAQFQNMTSSSQLANLVQSTQTTASQARANQLAAQTSLTQDAVDQASSVLQSFLGGKSPIPNPLGSGDGSSDSGSGGSTG
jgi:hypothetical protein